MATKEEAQRQGEEAGRKVVEIFLNRPESNLAARQGAEEMLHLLSAHTTSAREYTMIQAALHHLDKPICQLKGADPSPMLLMSLVIRELIYAKSSNAAVVVAKLPEMVEKNWNLTETITYVRNFIHLKREGKLV